MSITLFSTTLHGALELVADVVTAYNMGAVFFTRDPFPVRCSAWPR